jgi:hypothetical protein
MPFTQDYVRGLLFEPGVLKVASGVSSAAMTLGARSRDRKQHPD